MLSLRAFAGAPGFAPSALMCELVLEPGHRSGVSIRVELLRRLMRENVPVVFGTDWNTRACGRVARLPFRYRIRVKGRVRTLDSYFFLLPP